MKKVLYFFPDDISSQSAGNITRVLYLLKYFSDKGFHVDFVSIADTMKPDQKAKTEELLKVNNHTGNVFLLPRKVGKNNPVFYFFRYKIWDLLYYLLTYPLKSSIPTYLTLKLKSGFEGILKGNSYDHIIISYVQCADLISNKKLTGKARTIVDTHDLITAQFKGKRSFNLGVTFEDEIKRLNCFDEIWAISPEEQYIFNQFCTADVKLIPIMMDAPPPALNPVNRRKFDLIYVASDNIHNINSSKWFFEEVYPLLPAGLKTCVIGKINKYIPDMYNIVRVPFAKSLESYYNDSKIALCPMLQGTGVKVKVVEALSFGLPVVCTSRGTDGLPNKQHNGCLVSDNAAQFAENISALLTDRNLYNQQSNLGKQLFSNSFDSAVVFKLLDDTFM